MIQPETLQRTFLRRVQIIRAKDLLNQKESIKKYLCSIPPHPPPFTDLHMCTYNSLTFSVSAAQSNSGRLTESIGSSVSVSCSEERGPLLEGLLPPPPLLLLPLLLLLLRPDLLLELARLADGSDLKWQDGPC